MTQSQNPLLETGIPKFEEIRPDHVAPAIECITTEIEAALEFIETKAEANYEDLILTLEKIEERLDRAWGPVGHLLAVRNSDEMRSVYEKIQPKVVALTLQVSQNQSLFTKLKQFAASEHWSSLNATRKRIVEKNIESMELAGIGLKGSEKEEFNEISSSLSSLGTTFSNNVLDSIKDFSLIIKDAAQVSGMPKSVLEAAAQSFNQAKSDDESPATPEAGPWRVTLDHSSYLAFMKHCPTRPIREKIYRTFISRASDGQTDNSPLIDQILMKRKRKAELLGFDSFASLSLSRKMAGSVPKVEELLEKLRNSSWDIAAKELDELKALAAKTGITDYNHWDNHYFAERLSEKKFSFTEEELRPYFPLPSVLNGMFELVERIFEIKVVAADGEVPVWHKDVRYFKILNKDGNQIAGFHLDPYSRPEDKRSGAWMNECVCRKRTDDGIQTPVAYLVCNTPPPVGDKPSLQTFRDVETLFHEFGHGLQHMLTKIEDYSVGGIKGVEWDAVELPSQFMENWCYHKPTLMGFAKHYETGKPLPDELFEKLLLSKTFRAGTNMLRQLHFSMIDMELHHRYKPGEGETVFDVDNRVAQRSLSMPYLAEDRTLCSFMHIFAGGYAAGYYSYKWAEVLSADAFSAFEEAGLDDAARMAETGLRFRDTVLAEGGARPPMEVFKDFRGREPSIDPLLRHSGLA